MSFIPIVENYIIDQGSAFDEEFTWYESDGVTPIDLTDYTMRMQVRKRASSADPLLSLAIGTGITITDAPNGKFSIFVSAVDTAELPPCVAQYDLELLPNGDEATAFKLLRGAMTIRAEVTR